MSVWHNPVAAVPSLLGLEGELVVASITVEPHELEELLDALAHVPFPINPQIYHQSGVVEFPAYAQRVADVRATLETFGFNGSILRVRNMLDVLHASLANAPKNDGATPNTVLPYKQDLSAC
jgi:hypothetical protein